MASQLYLKIVTDKTQAQLEDIIRAEGEKTEQMIDLIDLLRAGMVGADALSLEIEVDAVVAKGTITPSSVVEDDTVTIQSVTLTAKDAPAGTAQFQVGTTDLETAEALKECINANPDLQEIVEAELDGAVVDIKAAFTGPLGDVITLASSSSTTLAVSDDTLTASTQGTTRRFNYNRVV